MNATIYITFDKRKILFLLYLTKKDHKTSLQKNASVQHIFLKEERKTGKETEIS